MINKMITAALTVVAVLAAQSVAASEAAPVVDLHIQAGDTTVFDGTIYASGCDVVDSEDTTHSYETATALCVLDQASAQSDFTYEVIDSSFGLYLNGITTEEADYIGDFTNYWSFYVDYAQASTGLATYEVTDGEELLLTFGSYGQVDPLQLTVNKKQLVVGNNIVASVKEYDAETEEFIYPTETTYVTFGDETVRVVDGKAKFKTTEAGELEVQAYSDASTSSATVTARVFKKKTASNVSAEDRATMAAAGYDYLLTEIDEDSGYISDNLSVTEWAVIAGAANGYDTSELYDVVTAYEPTVADGTSELARHILALEALGEDSRNFNGINFVKRLKKTKLNGQYGDESLANDDIFAGLALLAADAPVRSKSVTRALKGAKRGQNADGGVSYSVAAEVSDVDTTAFYVQLLTAAKVPLVKTRVGINKGHKRAVKYLKRQQNLNGGWDYQRATADTVSSNASSTAVALSAMKGYGKPTKKMRRNKQTPFNYLASVQRNSGAFAFNKDKDQSLETFNTVYAVLSLSGTPLPVRGVLQGE